MTMENDGITLLKRRLAQEQKEKLDRYRILNEKAVKGAILFTGSSLMENFPVNELLMSCGMPQIIYNRGIGGFTTCDMLEHMEEMVFGVEPSKIFINIGTNDIGDCNYDQKELLVRYGKILALIQERLPKAAIYVMAYYPVNETDKPVEEEWAKDLFATRTNENINLINREIEQMALSMNCKYIDLNDGLKDERGKLKKEFTVEGIHMYPNGYLVVLENLKKYL
ncbi:MAG: GDSL-type esterase/lipase family protein [Lachnospiraceae bacterium]|nr:GDSL-type esterase/lipase family protein [Lachnospiraceae bacterium]